MRANQGADRNYLRTNNEPISLTCSLQINNQTSTGLAGRTPFAGVDGSKACASLKKLLAFYSPGSRPSINHRAFAVLSGRLAGCEAAIHIWAGGYFTRSSSKRVPTVQSGSAAAAIELRRLDLAICGCRPRLWCAFLPSACPASFNTAPWGRGSQDSNGAYISVPGV